MQPSVLASEADAPIVSPLPPSNRTAAQRHSPSIATGTHPDGQESLLNENLVLDRALNATLARMTGGISPIALSMAFLDWASHLAAAPQRQLEIARDAIRSASRLSESALQVFKSDCEPWDRIKPEAKDHRFAKPEWETQPFNLMAQAFLLSEQWWKNATTGVRGVTSADEAVVEFSVRQVLDMFAPSNFANTNPEVLQKAFRSGGENFVFGWRNWCSDLMLLLAEDKDGNERSTVCSWRDRCDLIRQGRVPQRSHRIDSVLLRRRRRYDPEPVLIVPAWIMKYYILDLSPHNSLMKFLTAQGFTVFMICLAQSGRERSGHCFRRLPHSWASRPRLQTIGKVVAGSSGPRAWLLPGGRCWLFRRLPWRGIGDDRLKSITLLAAQTDFTEAGELTLFINDSQVAFLEDMMWERGYLDTTQMAGSVPTVAFERFDLVARNPRTICWENGQNPSDLMAWNADATRLAVSDAFGVSAQAIPATMTWRRDIIW